MVKRPLHSLKVYFYLGFALVMLLMSWESNRTYAAMIDQTIPEQAIRLRILANSDAPQDQLVKRQIRDAVVARMNGWVTKPVTIEEARQIVRAHIPEIQNMVGEMLQQLGYSYGYSVELGIVPFPTKMYGDKVYPAGNYEALRIVLGSGQGQNWWCVLFPPLCFVEGVSGEAVASAEPSRKPAKSDEANERSEQKEQTGQDFSASSDDMNDEDGTVAASADADQADEPATAELTKADSSKVKVRFFLWDLVLSIVKSIFG